jgi:hypothetical protein
MSAAVRPGDFPTIRAVRHYAARQAIATSSGRTIRECTRLAFTKTEPAVRISWGRQPLALRAAARPETLTDVVMMMNLTAWEGGEMLRRAASEAARCRVPGNGWVYSDVRHEFSDAWQLVRDRRHGEGVGLLELRLGRNMFPYIPFHREIDLIGLVGRHEEGHREEWDRDGRYREERDCDERDRDERDHDERHRDEDSDRDARPLPIRCLRSCGWPKLYHGAVDVRLGRVGRDGGHKHVKFRFPKGAGRVERVYVFWRYDLAARPEGHRGQDARLAADFSATARSRGSSLPEEARAP